MILFVCLVHGGVGPCVLSKRLFAQLSGAHHSSGHNRGPFGAFRLSKLTVTHIICYKCSVYIEGNRIFPDFAECYEVECTFQDN